MMAPGELAQTNRNLRARIVRIEFERGDAGLIFAVSPDLKGLVVAERTMEALEAAIPQAIMEMYAACGEAVVVSRVDAPSLDEDDETWVAFPVELARKALAASSHVAG